MKTKSEIEKEIEEIETICNNIYDGCLLSSEEINFVAKVLDYSEEAVEDWNTNEDIQKLRLELGNICSEKEKYIEGYNLGCKETAEEVEAKWKEKIENAISGVEKGCGKRGYIFDAETISKIPVKCGYKDKNGKVWLGAECQKIKDELKNLLEENQEENHSPKEQTK